MPEKNAPRADYSVYLFPGSFSALALDANPDEHDDNVEALAFAAVVLIGPHAILLLVPVRARRAVHSSSTDVRLAVGGSGFGACGNVGLLGLSLGAAAGLVEGGCGNEVLDDGAVAGELERGSGGTRGSRLGNDGLQDGVLDGG